MDVRRNPLNLVDTWDERECLISLSAQAVLAIQIGDAALMQRSIHRLEVASIAIDREVMQ